MNKDKLTTILHKYSKEKSVSFNIALQVFFFEGLLFRLSRSKYKEKLILKGGFLLSSILGVEQRSTLDMDFSVQNTTLSPKLIYKMISDIISTDAKDDISFRILKVTDIMQQNHYNGYQVNLVGKLDNINVPFSIDIASGDPITPRQTLYEFKSLLLEKDISLSIYNIETVLAEKLQTIIDKQTGNSRMKDFYDVYLISKMHRDIFDIGVLRSAIINTFQYRNTIFDKAAFQKLFVYLLTDKEFLNRWKTYVKRNQYVNDLNLDEIFTEILELLSTI